ncbi:MAG: spermidine/putrescine ABC transporter ATP-binding protein PotA [Rickettsiaceae bacterium]
MNLSQNPIIELKNINKSFNSESILRDFNFTLRENKFITILGPSGSGKTTIIKLIAGFESPDDGEIILNNIKVNHLPANKREVNTVFQNYSLFPHMSVYENIAFGLRMKKKSQSYIDKAVSDALKLIKLKKFADRKPGQLSGGQQQRVAIARAIINKPLILLLDEPLSALDEKLRKEMQIELKAMQKELGITFILVTHDQEEALSISDTIIVINNGKIEQIGSPQEIYETPVNSFVASFVGELNVLDAEIETIGQNQLTVVVEGVYTYKIQNKNNFAPKDKIKLLIRPEKLRLTPIKDASLANHLKGKISEIRYKGSLLDYVITLNNNNKKVTITMLQNKEVKSYNYKIGTDVFIEWSVGCEVLTK